MEIVLEVDKSESLTALLLVMFLCLLEDTGRQANDHANTQKSDKTCWHKLSRIEETFAHHASEYGCSSCKAIRGINSLFIEEYQTTHQESNSSCADFYNNKKYF